MPKPSWSGAAGGAATGAGTGFAIGGPPGAVAGTIIGGLTGLLTGNAGAKKQKTTPMSTQTKAQKTLEGLILEGLKTGKGPLGDLFGKFNEESFNKGVKEPALKNFQENILPELQMRLLAGNRSPGGAFRRQITKAGTDLQSKLAELMYNAEQGQNQNRIAGVNSLAGGRGVENIVQGGSPGAAEGVIKGALPNVASAFANKAADKLFTPTVPSTAPTTPSTPQVTVG
jgi:hypothetical protein